MEFRRLCPLRGMQVSWNKLRFSIAAGSMSAIGIFQQLAAQPLPISIEWPHVRCAATWRMGHHRCCHPLLALTVHRLVLDCELGDTEETQTKAFRLIGASMSEIRMFR